MITYKNENGRPIIRNCLNCKNYKAIKNLDRTGYCDKLKMMFAYTMESNVFAQVRSFYLCESHLFANEEHLKNHAESVDMRSCLKSKEEIK